MTEYNSLRHYGVSSLPVDMPTKRQLKLLADKAGLPVSHYLRLVVQKEQGNQGELIAETPAESLPAMRRDINSVKFTLNKLVVSLLCLPFMRTPALADPNGWEEVEERIDKFAGELGDLESLSVKKVVELWLKLKKLKGDEQPALGLNTKKI